MKNRKKELILLGILFVLCIAGAGIIGVSDNPPGIALAFIAVLIPFFAWTRIWKSPKSFLKLAGFSLSGFVVFVILHNLFYAIAKMTEAALIIWLSNVVSVASFLIAVLICPVGIGVGLVGAVILLVVKKQARSS